MAKSSYKIPTDLNASYLDLEIALRSSDGVGLKPLPLKLILAYLLSALTCLWCVMNSFIKYGNTVQKVIFVFLWIMLTMVLCKYDGTHRMQAQLIPTIITYMNKNNRKVITRKNASALPFYQIAGFRKEGIDKKTGLIHFMDGTYGFMYRIVGSASILLFDSDKVAILERVELYYQKVGTEMEHIFITTKSSQAVYKQLAAIKEVYDNLEDDDDDLKMLANEQFSVLKNYVGGSFKAIHQYLVIKGDNKEELIKAKKILASEVENSSLMIKRCVPLKYNDIVNVLELIYKGKDGGKA